MQRGRVIRVGISAALLAVVATTAGPYVTGRVSTSAVVNAPLTDVRAPFEGRITRASARAGEAVGADTRLLAVVADTRDDRHLEDLRARRDVLEGQLAAIVQQRHALQENAARMQARLERYRTHTLSRLKAKRRELVAELAGARAEAEQAAEAAGRSDQLVGKGYVSENDHARRKASARSAAARMETLRARIEGVDVEIAAVESGTFVRDGFNDVPYSQQQADAIDLRLNDLTREEARLKAERDGLSRQLAAETRRIARTELFQPRAAVNGVVWRASGQPGETVAPGQLVMQVADCQARFLEVPVDESAFDAIAPGDVAHVELDGSSRTFEARVTARRGAGARAFGQDLAAEVAGDQAGRLRVLVSLEGAALDRAPDAFCHIGRTAEVHFPSDTLGTGERMLEKVAGLAGGLASRVTALADRVTGDSEVPQSPAVLHRMSLPAPGEGVAAGDAAGADGI